MRHKRAYRRLGFGFIVLLISAACGTTVPLPSQGSLGPDAGLNGQALGAPASGIIGGGSAQQGGLAAQSTTSTGAGPTSTTNLGSSIGASGATPNRGPLTVGITYFDNSTSEAQLGASGSNTVNGKTATEALVRGINATGGLHGRVLKPIEYGFNTSDNDYSQDATVACEKFTKDNHVDVVLDVFGKLGGFGECVQKAGVLQITRGSEGDRTSSQRGTLHANTGTMVDDRTYAAVLTNLVSTRYLSRSNQLGIIVEECPTLERAYDKTILPLIARLGLKAPIKRTIQCTTGFASAGSASAAISSAVLAFHQANVDRVMFVSDFESVVLLFFGNNASSQLYHPGYALSSNAQAEGIRANIPSDQWPQLHGVGIAPGSDVAGIGVKPSPVEARCLQLAKAGGLTPANYSDKDFVYTACGLFLLLEIALQHTDGYSDPNALQRAINGLGTSFVAPGLVGNSTRFSSNAHDGPNAVRVFGYSTSCTCVRYSGNPLPAPP